MASDLSKYRTRLAEMCGIKVELSTFEQYQPSEWIDSDGKRHKGYWRPDEDIGQAIECLEALAAQGWRWSIENWRRYSIHMEPPGGGWISHEGDQGDLSRSIVSMIAKSLRWDRE